MNETELWFQEGFRLTFKNIGEGHNHAIGLSCLFELRAVIGPLRYLRLLWVTRLHWLQFLKTSWILQWQSLVVVKSLS